ncbi:unnamed protein product [Caenorhabditis bovis]|uniref:Proteasomal ubiquitin receptor ADRM1 homolog n=1 Tax=Caenorhabditis bovis TaxID=2654633 RepID=A0A8S1EPA3_9PELO|nr:unnamed protein product [Caenorhabditis bovis]
MAAMFSNIRSGGSGSGNIVEFKAGKSTLEPGSAENMKKVVANPKKGLVYVKQSNDMLVHFCWKDRETGEVSDDLIIFPGDTEFKQVNGCPDGKVYMLKFKSSKEMRLYWLQDGNPDADKDLVKKVNDALNKPPSSRPVGRGTSSDRLQAGGGFPASLGEDFGGPLGGLDQSQLISLIQSLQGNNSNESLQASGTLNAGSETDVDASMGTVTNQLPINAPPVFTNALGPSTQGNSITPNDLTNMLKNLKSTTQGPTRVNVSLSEQLSTQPVVDTAQANRERLTPHLPETENAPEKELTETIRAVPFKQAVDTLGHALQTGQLGPVLSQFGLNEQTINSAAQGDLRGFAKNLTIAEGGPLPLGEDTDDSTKEPEAKRNRPDMEDMDMD